MDIVEIGIVKNGNVGMWNSGKWKWWKMEG